MTITTTDEIAGKTIKTVHGLVKGNSARARNIGRDILAFAKNIVGGEVIEYTKLVAEAREQALDRMEEQAKEKGANAIVGMRFSSAEVTQGVSDMLAYGTAVTIE